MEGVFSHSLFQSAFDLVVIKFPPSFETAASALLIDRAKMETAIGPAWEDANAIAHLNVNVKRSMSVCIEPGLNFFMFATMLLISLERFTACNTPG